MQTATEKNVRIITCLFVLDLPRIRRVPDEFDRIKKLFEPLALAAENNQ